MRPEILFPLFAPVQRVKGVGPIMGKQLARLLLGDETAPAVVRDALLHFPVSVIDRRFMPKLFEAPADMVCTFVVKVEEHFPVGTKMRHASKKPYRVLCSNETGDLMLVFFSPRTDYLKNALPVGEMRVVSGRTEKFDYRLQMTHPDIIAPLADLEKVKRVEPLYPLTLGLTNRRIHTIIQTALTNLPNLPEWIEAELIEKEKFPSWAEAIKQIHAPLVPEEIDPNTPARRRIAYDEILAYQLHLARLRSKMQQKPGQVFKGTHILVKPLLASLPFKLTNGQVQVLKEIGEDLGSGRRMVRLLQGDVGSGKTIVALLAMLRVVEEGAQAALMVPTEIIAEQHYQNLRKLCEPLGVKVVLLTGSIKGAERKQVLDEIVTGKAQLTIGTHALFQEHVEFKNLAITVIDEQHRFGVNQRMAIAAKGNNPHILHMTATPIPRSLTMTLYGDMDCSLLLEKPAERKPITTRVIPLSRYKEMMEGIERALKNNEKIYWICPLIDADTELVTAEMDIAAANSRFIEFKARFGAQVGLVHGRMSAAERHDQMARFARGDIRLLVATTVVEVGVDVKDATIMVIEQAERFGLSQLHQLRGRVGRSDKQSSCVLLYNDKLTEEGRARLSIVRETEDGFKIAEEDLRLRGGGEILGTRQSGRPEFLFTDIGLHYKLIEHAKLDATKFFNSDPNLQTERGKSLNVLLELFGYS